jgi:lipoic acid synthetase
MPLSKHIRKPEWLKINVPSGNSFKTLKKYRVQSNLATVCEEANCPNMGECWNAGTATFMLMGDTCTRGCRFCSVKTSNSPPPLDSDEPSRLAETLRQLNLRYVVLTTVDRDDLPDQGAAHIRKCVETVRRVIPELIIEILIPDFQGNSRYIGQIVDSGARVIGHNVECVRRLTSRVRDPRAGYEQSLGVLRTLKELSSTIHTKSSLMLGFGETEPEILEAMGDIRRANVDFLTLGQYLCPEKNKLPVEEYVTPEKFEYYKRRGVELGFAYVASGPLVRSSFQAADNYLTAARS